MSGREGAVRFDRDYYARYYDDPRTQVASEESVGKLADLVVAYANALDLRIERAYDLGCGLGLWRDALAQRLPGLNYTGVEVSEYLVARHGWISGSVVDFDPLRHDLPPRADLVICQGVLQYISEDRDAKRAIRNLAQRTGKLLYLEALTRTDWDERCAQEYTDGDVVLRPLSWYRRHLSRHFVPLGMGLFMPQNNDRVFFQLEEVGWA